MEEVVVAVCALGQTSMNPKCDFQSVQYNEKRYDCNSFGLITGSNRSRIRRKFSRKLKIFALLRHVRKTGYFSFSDVKTRFAWSNFGNVTSRLNLFSGGTLDKSYEFSIPDEITRVCNRLSIDSLYPRFRKSSEGPRHANELWTFTDIPFRC